MNLFPFKNTWRETILLYRFLRYRKGFGVHSPFAFAFITKVIDENYGYYHYYDIELIRRQLVHRKNKQVCNDIKRSHGKLLFRTVNYFKPENLLQIGASAGISTLYLSAYSAAVKCISLEKNPECEETIRWSLKKYNNKEVDIRIGDYEKTLGKALQDLDKVDFVFFNASAEKEKNRLYFEEAMKYIHPDSVFFFEGIRDNKEMRTLWKEICEREDVVLTFDLYNVGIVFFNKRLHKKNYIVYF